MNNSQYPCGQCFQMNASLSDVMVQGIMDEILTVSILNRYAPLKVQIGFEFQQISLDDPRYFGCICEVFRCLEDSGYPRL